MLEQILDYLKSNQFASGGLIAVACGSIIMYGKQTFYFIRQSIVRKFTIQVTVRSGCDQFNYLAFWLYTHKKIKKCKDILLRDGGDKERNGISIPNYGTHIFWIDYKPYTIHIERDKENEYSASDVITISTIGTKVDSLFKLVTEARESYESYSDGNTIIYMPDWGDSWGKHATKKIHQFNPILGNNLFETILDDVNWFLSNESEYEALGISYKRGYILHGEPGNGKTTTILSIAQRLGYDIASLSLSNTNLSDNKLIGLLNSIPTKSLLVLEDIDCLSETHARKDDDDEFFQKSGLTLGTLLNALDGLYTPHGLIVFATTNHIDKLDKALIRRGRFDLIKEIKKPEEPEIQRMADRIGISIDPSKYVGMPMCDIVEELRNIKYGS